MWQNRLLVRLTSVHTHTHTEQIQQELLAAQVTDSSDFPDSWSCSEERLPPLREGVQTDTTELCRHDLIYIQRIDLP